MQALKEFASKVLGRNRGGATGFIGVTPETRRDAERYMGLSGDLSGKKILELYSGSRMQSFRDLVEESGGEYYSVDNDRSNHHGVASHRVANARRVGRIYNGGEPFDAVIMRGAPWWGRDFDHKPGNGPEDYHFVSLKKVLGVVKDSISLLGENPGGFVGIGGGCIQADVEALRLGLRQSVANFDEEWKIETRLEDNEGVETKLFYRDEGGEFISVSVPSYAVRIVRTSGE